MNQGNNNGGGGSNGTSFAAKVGYIGTGVIIGLVVYPFVRKALKIIQPKMDKILDGLTGKAEEFAEKASDMIFRAKESVKAEETHSHAHAGASHAHHSHDKTNGA